MQIFLIKSYRVILIICTCVIAGGAHVKGMTNSPHYGQRLHRTGSVDTLSPCESIASDDLMLDYDTSDASSYEEQQRLVYLSLNNIIRTIYYKYVRLDQFKYVEYAKTYRHIETNNYLFRQKLEFTRVTIFQTKFQSRVA
jgi:hypothetical protein